MNRFSVGDKVKVPHGTGVVVGFEKFDAKGYQVEPHHTQSLEGSERIIIKLDSGHSWPCNDEFYCSYNYDTFKVEFSIGQSVTFQSYPQNDPLEREVIKITDFDTIGNKDGRIFYHLGKNGVVTNITTGKSILESEHFSI